MLMLIGVFSELGAEIVKLVDPEEVNFSSSGVFGSARGVEVSLSLTTWANVTSDIFLKEYNFATFCGIPSFSRSFS